jgi:hypothetical protein
MEELRNAEFTLVVPHVLNIVDGSPLVQQLEKQLNGVKAFLPDLDRIEAQERRWRESLLLSDIERSRDGHFNMLIHTEKAFSRVVGPGYEEVSEKLTALFNKHGRDIASDRNTAMQQIYNLTEDIERTSGMLDLLSRFALLPVYKEMKQANIRFDELWQQRNRELSKNERVDSELIRTGCIKALSTLYDGIEYLATESEDPAWLPLIRELSRLSSYYKQQLKARDTRWKNKEYTTDEPLIRPDAISSAGEN